VTSLAAAATSLAVSGTNDVTPGLLGFLVVAGLGVALFFLLRSMNKHLRRVQSVRDAGLAPGGKEPADNAGTGASDKADGSAAS